MNIILHLACLSLCSDTENKIPNFSRYSVVINHCKESPDVTSNNIYH